jgi:uncharacterized protein (TIGR03032 family)
MTAGLPAAGAFSVTIAGQFATILQGLGATIALASYQASSLLLVSPAEDGIAVLPRAFDKPMSVCEAEGRLALALRNEVLVLAASRAVAPGYPRAPGRYAQLWLPRTLRFTGEVDLHDLSFAGSAVIGVATRLSCIARLDDSASLTPLWQPPFVSDLVPEDRCHLNGVALDEAGMPRFATALGATDTPEGWRAGRVAGGVLMSVPDGRIVLDGLCMPHSPRLIGGVLHVLNSGAGEVLRVDPARGEATVLARLPGYTRGLAVRGNFLFVGLSRLRDRRGAGATPLPVERDGQKLACGVAVLDRESGRVLGSLTVTAGADEIADIAVLPGPGRHGILSHTDTTHRSALALPDQGFWATSAG